MCAPQEGRLPEWVEEQSPQHQSFSTSREKGPRGYVLANGQCQRQGPATGAPCHSWRYTGSAKVLALTPQPGHCSSAGVSPPLTLHQLCSGQVQTLPREGQPCLTRPGLTTSELFHGFTWEDTSACAFPLLAQFQGTRVWSKIKFPLFLFFPLEAISGKLISLGNVSWPQTENGFFGKIVFRGSKNAFPYRYRPVETACLNRLPGALQSSSQTWAILKVRTGISAIAFAFLFRRKRPFRGVFWWISLDCHCFYVGSSYTDFSPVAIFLLFSLHLQISPSVKALTTITSFFPCFFWVLHDNQSLSVESLFPQSIQAIPCTHKTMRTMFVA